MTAEDLPPTQYLVLEVLAARWRTGEVLWTFPSNLRAVMDRLARLGLVGWKSGVAPASIQAWLTDAGRDQVLKADFETPVQRALDCAARDLRSGYRTGDRSIEYICGFEDAAGFAERYISDDPANAAHQARLASEETHG